MNLPEETDEELDEKSHQTCRMVYGGEFEEIYDISLLPEVVLPVLSTLNFKMVNFEIAILNMQTGVGSHG